MDLPSRDAYEFLGHHGGYAIITREGVTLFREALPDIDDEQHREQRERELLLRTAEHVAAAVSSYSDLLDEYSSTLTALMEAFKRKDQGIRYLQRALPGWEEKLFNARERLLHADAQLATLPAGLDSDRLRNALARMWGLAESRQEVRTLIDRVEDFMRSIVVKRSERRQRVYGSLLSASALAIVLGQIWKPIGATLPLGTHAQNLLTLLAYLSGFAIGLGVFWLLGIRREA